MHAMRWERMLLWGCPLLFLLAWGVPFLPLWHAIRWECTLPFRGSPPLSGLGPCAVGVHAPSLCPFLSVRGLRALLGLGVPFLVLGPVVWGVLCWCDWGSPPVPPLRAVGTRC